MGINKKNTTTHAHTQNIFTVFIHRQEERGGKVKERRREIFRDGGLKLKKIQDLLYQQWEKGGQHNRDGVEGFISEKDL